MKLKSLLFALVCGSFMFTACSDDDAPVANTENVPQSVQNEFKRLYKDVKEVQWETVKGYHVARFNGPITRGGKVTFTSSAWFTQDGRHCQSEQELKFEELPAMVQEGFMMFKEVNYPDWTIDECEIVNRAGMGTIFVVEIEKGEEELEVSLSDYGDILKVVPDDDDDDMDDILPIEVPEQLINALKNLFPDNFQSLSIVEIDFDKNEIEVDVMMGTEHIELTFSLDYKWISTEYEESFDAFMKQLDQNYKEAKEKFLAWIDAHHIDTEAPDFNKHIEIEVEEHYQKGKSYSVEIKIGKLEVEFHIDHLGNITIEED